MKNKEDIKFRIDQMRKDKMIYALESIALTLVVFFTLFTMSALYPYLEVSLALQISIIIVAGYWLYAAIGNTIRLVKIRKLEKKL